MSTGSNSGGSAENSDNSALVSFGNNSFGFNFDSEDAMMNSSSDGDGSGGAAADIVAVSGAAEPLSEPTPHMVPSMKPGDWHKQPPAGSEERPTKKPNKSSNCGVVSVTSSTVPMTMKTEGHSEAADAAVANLKALASQFAAQPNEEKSSILPGSNRKRKIDEDADSGGYNSDDEGANSGSQSHGTPWNQDTTSFNSLPAVKEEPGIKEEHMMNDEESLDDKKSGKNGNKREERNAREKERSFRISRQINELRSLLSSGGVIVPKGTKSSVLSEAANYIRMLQQHQYRSEIDRHQLIQQMQIIGGGALGPQAASAIRHVAAQNGVWSLGNFGGVPPKSAMTSYQQGEGASKTEETNPNQQSVQAQSPSQEISLVTKVEDHEYRYIFNCSSVGTGIASMGGAFIDCNPLFSQLSQYSKQEVCSMTIFNLTKRADLQHAFDLISQMISPPLDSESNPPSLQCVLRGTMKQRNDLGLSISLIKGSDGIAKCFCVTLIKNPASPFDASPIIPATVDFLLPETPHQMSFTEDKPTGISRAPAYTTG